MINLTIRTEPGIQHQDDLLVKSQILSGIKTNTSNLEIFYALDSYCSLSRNKTFVLDNYYHAQICSHLKDNELFTEKYKPLIIILSNIYVDIANTKLNEKYVDALNSYWSNKKNTFSKYPAVIHEIDKIQQENRNNSLQKQNDVLKKSINSLIIFSKDYESKRYLFLDIGKQICHEFSLFNESYNHRLYCNSLIFFETNQKSLSDVIFHYELEALND